MARANESDATQQNQNGPAADGTAGGDQSQPAGTGNTQPAGNDDAQGAGETETPDYKSKYEQAIAHAREWEKRAKANKEAQDELQKLKDAQKTEEEKRQERLEELERENAEYKAREQRAEWRAEVSDETGVPANILRGNTREEIEAHAEALKAVLPDPEKAQNDAEEAQRQRSNQSTANAFSQSPGDSPATIQQKLAAAEKAGDAEAVANLKASMLGAQN